MKRSVPTDGRGAPLGGVVEGANRNDHKPMRQTLEAIPVAIPVPRPKPTHRRRRHLCLDEGHDSAEPRRIAAGFGVTLRPRTPGEEIRAKRHAIAVGDPTE